MWNGLADTDEAPEAGCSWPIVGKCSPGQALDADVRDWTRQMAVEILWAASGRQFGVCASTLRPCVTNECEVTNTIDAWNLVGRGGWLGWDPWGGSVFANLRCGCGRDRCECKSYSSFVLWHRNVREITEVMIDGVVLDPSAYRLYRNRLYRVDGGVWPTCQDPGVAPDQVGAWTVSYVHGVPVPYGGRVAAGLYSCELGKALCHATDCALPRRVQTVTRQGVSVAFVDPMQFIDQGTTGVYEVDVWLKSVNPNKLQREARVYRADDPRRRHHSRA